MLTNPLLTFKLDVMHHGVTRPHNGDVLLHLAAESLQPVFISPATVVACGAHDDGAYILVLFNKVISHIIANLRLAFSFTDFTACIIKGYGKVAHAQVVHKLQFVANGIQIVLTPIFAPVDGISGVNGPNELNVILFSDLAELGNLLSHVGRVRLTATPAMMVGVILRSPDVSIHLIAPIKTHLRLARLMTPRNAIITFYRAAIGNIGPVNNAPEG